ncbi:hypothetical protein [Neorhizobium sp. JUb45]|uniref:hypothetical protein n=1 Tax=Neorhizobium sp. JUb45 TaxID=2485113 RepID=UPI00104D65BB|nr:hypothetical protein [Neorhizobium sp. JUb45]TCR01093.1 hypothetical protein EDF70_10598 [Neorhizobium sp. JUb45]
MENILRLPVAVRRFPRLAFDNTRPEDVAAEQRRMDELCATRNYLLAALTHINREIDGLCVPQRGIRDAIPMVEAALFHNLTLDGCSETDRPLRNMLVAREELRDRNNAS